MLEHTLSADEHSQIVQTIEMFEAITQTQPEDYQSLEILKEAYAKVGRHDDALRTSRKLSEAYFSSGSFTLALQECESILIKQPGAPEILAMLGEIEQRLKESGEVIASHKASADLTKVTSVEGSLIDIDAGRGTGKLLNLNDRGYEQLSKFLIVQQLFNEEEVKTTAERVTAANKELADKALATSMVEELCQGKDDRLEVVISALIDRTKFAYVPLEYYDIDRQIAPMLPNHLTLGRLFVPFDLVSRTMMVACCNPFDVNGREAVQQSVDYTVAWYLARPSAILKSLQSIYKLEAKA